MDPDPDPDSGLTIVILGNAGVGKSATGNTILGRTAFESKRSFRSVTTKISEATETLFGKQISVIDTPGILGSEQLIRTWCQDHLSSSRPCLFLVVVKIDRFTIEQKNAVEAAIRVIGDQDFGTCYLLFTGGDKLNNESLDDFINEDPDGPLRPVFERFEGRHHVFNNKDGGQDEVKELLMMSGHVSNVTHPTEKRRIILLGLPGVGKSSAGNTILGSRKFTSGCDFNPVSTKSESQSGRVEGRQVTVVDTPGFTNEVLTPKQLYLEIMKSLVEASPGPHAFVIVVRLGRVSAADIRLFEILPTLFGADASKYTMVLFTHGDELRGRSIDQMIQSNRCVSQLVSSCGGRYCVFDNRETGNRHQVRNLLDMIDQMVTDNTDNMHYTPEMFFKAQPITRKISIKWDESCCAALEVIWNAICEWFTQMINNITKCFHERVSLITNRNMKMYTLM